TVLRGHLLREQRLDAVEVVALNDGRVLPLVTLGPMRDQPGVRRVAEDVENRRGAPSPAAHAAGVEERGNRARGALLPIEREDLANQRGSIVVYDEALVDEAVAQRCWPPGPLPAPPRRRNLVPGPLRDQLPLELGEAHEEVQRQPPDRVGGAEVL